MGNPSVWGVWKSSVSVCRGNSASIQVFIDLDLCFVRVYPHANMDSLLSRLFSSEEEELYILDCMGYFMVFMAACTFVTLLFENVPYGRYATSKYGFPVNVRLAWFIQELPAFLVPFCLVFWTSSAKTSELPNQLLIAMYFCHYVQRSLIYPFLIRGGKPTPFVSFVLAIVFCLYNGYMQIRYLSHYAEYPAHWVTHPCFIAGSALWLVGWLMNVHSDHILRNLRKPGETGYKIPTGKGLSHQTLGTIFCQSRIHFSIYFLEFV
ncbi:3-oxo-5-alpha-steroid 4-dehydrogenase 1 isoform X1 [Xyrichtys novacula]|uniref:3-oxo-5-alpha-steroid 4-dehydrogenase 1 isoform X1 n=1 Tax=Xyrichtys novacula TaxID=13765 RepID=A0AAV1HEM9_XYRNO|nr:3-oxo-5-alpha-steroid 4-dehydrogenase 1 isoform X1 [Xyrichtys novacula]